MTFLLLRLKEEELTNLYETYCQNKPRADDLIVEFAEDIDLVSIVIFILTYMSRMRLAATNQAQQNGFLSESVNLKQSVADRCTFYGRKDSVDHQPFKYLFFAMSLSPNQMRDRLPLHLSFSCFFVLR